MSRSAFPIRIMSVVGVVALASLLLAGPVGALNPLLQGTITPEPPPRPTAEPLPYIELTPTSGVAGDPTQVTVTGGLWSAGHTVSLYWDDFGTVLAQTQVNGDGTIQTTFTTPTDPQLATVGLHKIIARATDGQHTEADFELIAPTPTSTPSPTVPPPPPSLFLDPTQGVAGDATRVKATGAQWMPGESVTLYWDADLELGSGQVGAEGTIQIEFKTPKKKRYASVGSHKVLARATGGAQAEATFQLIEPTVTLTPSPTTTPSPSPTLRPLTPMVTVSPIPPTKAPAKVATKPPSPTRTATPIPGTPTPTPTPSITPTATDTPGPGTPMAVEPTPTETPTPTPTSTPVEEISDTGAGWGTVFLWGFVLAGLLVVFRLLRVRGLQERS